MKASNPFSLVLACFFLSGASGLIYETVWLEELGLVFGTTEIALASTLSAYMAGLGIGAAIGGRLIDRIVRPIRVYALLELGIAASALSVPFALQGAASLQQWMLSSENMASASTSSGLFYFVMSFMILLVPTSLMGATLPILARHAIHHNHELGGRIAWLYTANTAGAACGTCLQHLFCYRVLV